MYACVCFVCNNVKRGVVNTGGGWRQIKPKRNYRTRKYGRTVQEKEKNVTEK